jgi:hypothetical protein
MVTTVSIRYSMCSMENTHVCTSCTTQISTLSPSPTSRNLVPLLLRPAQIRLRSGSGSAQVYSLCSLRCGRVKRNCQLLTSSKIGSMGAKTFSLGLPVSLSARLPDACTHLYCWSLSGLLNTAYLCVSSRRQFRQMAHLPHSLIAYLPLVIYA